MTDLVEFLRFLRARLQDDEQVARKAPQHAWDDEYGEFRSRGGETFDHILRHDPARVLREVEAKRQRLSRYEAALAAREAAYEAERATYPNPSSTAVQENNQAGAVLRAWNAAVALDALPYVDHPDYRPEWRVELT